MTVTQPCPPVRPIWTALSTDSAPEAERTERHLGLHDIWPADMAPGEWIQIDLNDGSSRIASNEVGFMLLLGQLQKLANDRGDAFSAKAYRCRPVEAP